MAVNTAGWGTTTPAAPGAYITDDGTAVPITATPASGYVFKLTIALLDTGPFYIGVHYLSRYLEIDPNEEHGEGDV